MGSEQRRIVVVGAGSGIGAATAAHFHTRGDHVLAVDVRENETPAAEHRTCDLRDTAAVDALLHDIGSGWDLLAHVAGVPGTAPPADVLTINYLGMRLMTEGMLPLLHPGGAVVAVASTAGAGWAHRTEVLEGLLGATDTAAVESWLATQDPSYPVYNTSKEAVILYAKRLAAPAWTKYGVRINTVSPGPTETPILADFEQSMGVDVLDMVRSTVGRHATVDDIVPIIDFLGSPAARWVTGQDVWADGGFVSSILAGTPIDI
ncbi:coniferyl-alcohol dehydrogenase [Aldersonia sp. NBC_00410]|uniref:coniferyl-alcohol dehydrogenase n=1 Tax=Aldersonia sp. NBC_00410 TaxID=2975954 RepID=UPI002258F96A|nr:coniferyl-alcohol dehydrogenase [Aldersonia sp. NBC_00410]MCX5045372.1 coniferyl-alcohol dehydrogenase [Aldersonia sp. NBC_00410]